MASPSFPYRRELLPPTPESLRGAVDREFAKIETAVSSIAPALPALVVDLPPPGSVGRRAFVTNATATTFGSIVAGGGSNKVPVFDNGTNWVIG